MIYLKIAKIIYKSNKWDIEIIYKFLNFSKNISNKWSELQVDIIKMDIKNLILVMIKK